LMGQGGSASGYPLTYYGIKKNKLNTILQEKNDSMIRSLDKTAIDCGFDSILAYACLHNVNIDGKEYAYRAAIPHADYCNKVADSSKFIDVSPGDVFIPSKDNGLIIPITRSLHINQKFFYNNENIFKWPKYNLNNLKSDKKKIIKFLSYFEKYLNEKQNKFKLKINDIGINFKFEVIDDNEKFIYEVNHDFFHNQANRFKICRVRASILKEVIEGRIPFEDLSIGYLAEWKREPDSIYNKLFMTYLKSFWNYYLVNFIEKSL